MKKISIITPSFNQGSFIEDAIKSVINQGDVVSEHIIIDGGSSDNTLEVLKKYPNIYWISEKDRGQTHALNKALDKTTGDIIGWLNADDYYENNIFKKIINFFDKKQIDGLYGNMNHVDKNKNIIKKNYSKKKFFFSRKFTSKFICIFPSTTFFWKKGSLDKIKFDENCEFTMDKDYFASVCQNHKVIEKIDLLIANMRLHENNKLENKADSLLLNYRVSEGIYIFNKYSNFKIPSNFFGKKIYILIQKLIIFLNYLINRF